MGLITAGSGLTNSKLRLANANPNEVLSGKTFYSKDKTLKTGSMPNKGAWKAWIGPGSSVNVPAGYHDGSGKVTANYAVWQDVVYIYDSDLSPYIGVFTYRNTESWFTRHYSNSGDYNDELIRIHWDGAAYHWFWNIYANVNLAYQQDGGNEVRISAGQPIVENMDHDIVRWYKIFAQ